MISYHVKGIKKVERLPRPLEMTLYVGNDREKALGIEDEYDLLITEVWVEGYHVMTFEKKPKQVWVNIFDKFTELDDDIKELEDKLVNTKATKELLAPFKKDI